MAECEWPVTYAGCGGCDVLDDADETDTDGETRTLFETIATDYLRAWTGGRYGLCETTIRPCNTDECGVPTSTFAGRGPYGTGASPWTPVIIGGRWFNLTCGACRGPCTCAGQNSIRLPGPVDEIIEILIDGNVVDPDTYRVLDREILVRGDGPWPRVQNLTAEATSPDTFQITYTRGTVVPTGGQLAAGVLACELAKAACGDTTCQLPERVQTVTRQGVSVAILDAFEDVNDGRTGIWLIDSWLAAVTKTPGRATVRSVDVHPVRPGVTTWRRTL